MSENDNEIGRIVLPEGGPQGGTPSAVGTRVPRERVGREGELHQERLEVGASAEGFEVGVAVHPGDVAITPGGRPTECRLPGDLTMRMRTALAASALLAAGALLGWLAAVPAQGEQPDSAGAVSPAAPRPAHLTSPPAAV